ncbi:putative hydrolase [Candidatus Mycoplasma haematohominis]|uniref:Putative hydrolase n=1 Tax=Candidatus Mycoplasma haematohominis TaxID=1494318 RepID=A0A478FPG7_9MOLU|nr:putative hydrolase [Candidatus Mycoplasma haemohominis]
MSKYKYLIVTDLDGTLLNSKGELSPLTVDYVRKLNKRDDVFFSFSTERCWRDSEKIYRELELKGFVSCCNGALLYDPVNDISVYSYLSELVWEGVLSNDDFFRDFLKGDVLSDKENISFDASTDRVDLIRRLKESNGNVYGIKTYFRQLGTSEDQDNVDKRLMFLKSFELPPYVTIYYYAHNKTINIEIQADYVSKEKAVEFLSNYYGVNFRNVLTYGDQINDLPVAAGKSFCTSVKNAIDLMKFKSDKVSEFTNDEDVVVREIDLFLKKAGVL